MEQSKHIVAIEIGSSHIAGVVARIDAPGSDAAVVCCYEVPVLDSVRYGCIVNVDEVYNKIDTLMQRMQKNKRISTLTIDSVYVALSCRSLHTQTVTVDRALDETQPVSKALIADIYDEARSRMDGSDVIDIRPRLYAIDGREEDNPVGALGTSLHAELSVVVCRPNIRRNVQLVFDRLQKKVNGYIVTPLALADSLTGADERKLGVVLVDHGAETTSVTIYNKGKLQYLNVLPLGSRNITRDLCSLGITEDSADKIKRNYGDATADGKDVKSIDISGVPAADVVGFVTSRAGEIMMNVLHQIELSGLQLKQFAGNGIVCVGRGMALKHMPELLGAVTDLPVRIGRMAGVSDSSEYARYPQLLSVIDAISQLDNPADCMSPQKMPEYEMPHDEPIVEYQPVGQEETPQPEKKKNIGGGFFNRLKYTLEKNVFGQESEMDDDI